MREAARDLDRLLHIKEAIGRVQAYMKIRDSHSRTAIKPAA